jgi:hypothetical protein
MKQPRRYPRIARSIVRVEGLSAEVMNIGLGGIGLTIRIVPEVGTRLDLKLRDGLSCQTQQLQAQVVWRQGCRCGLKWVNLTPEQRAWLAARLQFWLGHRAVIPDAQ